MAVSRSFAALALCGMLVFSRCLAAPGTDAGPELGRLAERVYHVPKEVLGAVAAIRRAPAPASLDQEARVLEILSRARLRIGDPQGALEQARLLESLGKRNANKTFECLGILQQAYANFMLGEVQASHALTRRAMGFPPSLISPEARVKTLLTMAQVHDELKQPAAARASVAEALRIARLRKDANLLFLGTKMEAARGIAAGELGLAAASVDRLLALGRQAPYREQLVRAIDTEFDYATAAGLASRARRAMDENIRLMKELGLHDALAYALVNYADFALKSKRFGEAAALSREALDLEAVRRDEPLARTAHANHAFASIYLGKVAAGK